MAASDRLLPTPDSDSMHVDITGPSEDVGIVADFQTDYVDETEASSTAATSEQQRPVVVTIEPMKTKDFPEVLWENKIPIVKCQVCQKRLNIKARIEDALVKCPGCKEVTPLRAPSSGKKCVRCLCNRLYVHLRQTAWYVCLRPDCGKIVIMGKTKKSCCAPPRLRPEDVYTVTCYRCKKSVFWNITEKTCYCPRCGARSTISRKYVLLCAAFYAIIAIVNLATGILSLAFNRLAETSTVCRLGFSGSIIVGLVIGICALYIGCTKVSHVEGPWCDPKSGQIPKQREFWGEIKARKKTKRQRNTAISDCDSGIACV